MKVVKDSPERRLALEISSKGLCLRSGASSHAPGGFPCPGLATDKGQVLLAVRGSQAYRGVCQFDI